MESSVSTKFLIPQLDIKLVPRPPLMQLYNQGLQRRLTVVAAPAGYGKTTSTAMWLRACDDPELKTAWYALDADDDEFSTFFTRFVMALETAMPHALATMATGLDLQGISPGNYAQVLADACLKLPNEVILVLDDYHLITAPDIHAVLAHLVQYASSRLHLVLATRYDPPLPIARLRVQQQVTEVRADDLRLSDGEATKLLETRLAQPPPAQLVSLVQTRTEGWAAGLQLTAMSLGQESPATFLESFQRNEAMYVLDFLIDEVLAHAPLQIKDFLLKTALMTRFNVDLAVLLTQFDAAVCRQILERLRRQNTFLVPLDREHTWFRYHHQFRAMLVNRAGFFYAPDLLRTLHEDATNWLVEHGWTDEAFAEYVAEGAWERAADLFEADRHALQNRQEWHLLWRRLEKLPQEVVARRPGLLLAKAWILQLHRRLAAVSTLVEQAAALLAGNASSATGVQEEHNDGGGQQVLWGEIDALRAAPFRPDIPAPQRLELIQEALRFLHPAHKYEWVRGYAFVSLVHAMLRVGQRDEVFRQVMREIESVDLGSGRYLARLHQALGVVVYYDGPLEQLKQITARYLELALQHDLPVAAAYARLGLAWSMHQQYEEAQAVYETVAPVFARMQVINLGTALMALPVLVAAGVEAGRIDDACQILEEVGRVALERENIAAVDEVSAARAYAALLRGDCAAATAWVENFLRTPVDAMGEYPYLERWAPLVFTCARILLSTGTGAQLEQVLAPLTFITEFALRCGFVVDALQGAVLLACCYWRIHQPVKALEWLQRALAMGVPRGFRRVFFEQGADLPAMLRALVERRADASLASMLLKEYGEWAVAGQGSRFQPRPATQSALAEQGVTALTDREQEVLVLLAEQLSNKEIAQRLHVSALTVRNHTSSIYSKLNVASRKQAVALANALHLLSKG